MVEVVVEVVVEVGVVVEVVVEVGVVVVEHTMTTRKTEDVVSVETSELNGWEVVEEYKKTTGRCVSSLLSLRKRIDRGFLVRTFHQFYDGTVSHVSMSETYVPDPNEQWTLPA